MDRRRFLKTTTAISAASALGSLSGLAQAQAPAYPFKTIRIVVPYSAGGNVDLTARVFAKKLTESLGQQVFVDNRPGASCIIGSEFVARSAPDGYTLMLIGVGSAAHTLNPSLFAKLPYNTVRDFAAISSISRLPLVLVVHPSVRAESVRDLIALAKAKPGEINAATGGKGGASNLALELFMAVSGTKFTQIHYKGNAPGLADTIAGQTSMMIETESTVLSPLKAGRLRALAVTSLKRSPMLPEVPTISEIGFPGYEVIVSLGLLAPAATPRDIVSRLSTEVARITRDPETRQFFAKQGTELTSSTPDEFAAYIEADIAKWEKVIRQAGIKAQ